MVQFCRFLLMGCSRWRKEAKERGAGKSSKGFVTCLNIGTNVEKATMADSKNLKFIVFLLHILADAWHRNPSSVYAVLKDSGVLDGYILPSYDVLHTLGARYLVQDITGCVRDWGYQV